jgi:hypothetical protein
VEEKVDADIAILLSQFLLCSCSTISLSTTPDVPSFDCPVDDVQACSKEECQEPLRFD